VTKGEEAVGEPVNYHLVLKYPDRSEPELADFTSFTGELQEGDLLSLPEKGDWRIETIEELGGFPHPRLSCVPGRQIDARTDRPGEMPGRD
jgi:hypothetical protein